MDSAVEDRVADESLPESIRAELFDLVADRVVELAMHDTLAIETLTALARAA